MASVLSDLQALALAHNIHISEIAYLEAGDVNGVTHLYSKASSTCYSFSEPMFGRIYSVDQDDGVTAVISLKGIATELDAVMNTDQLEVEVNKLNSKLLASTTYSAVLPHLDTWLETSETGSKLSNIIASNIQGTVDTFNTRIGETVDATSTISILVDEILISQELLSNTVEALQQSTIEITSDIKKIERAVDASSLYNSANLTLNNEELLSSAARAAEFERLQQEQNDEYYRIVNAVVSIDPENGTITNRAYQYTNNKFTEASLLIDGVNAAISLEAQRIDLLESGYQDATTTLEVQAGLINQRATYADVTEAVAGAIEAIQPAYVTSFNTSDDGWTALQGSVTYNTGKYLDLTFGDIQSPALSVDGSTNPTIQLGITRSTGSSWVGKLYWSTASHGFVEEHSIFVGDVPDNSLETSVIIDLDANADYSSSTITGLRLLLGSSESDTYKVGSVQVGKKNAAQVAVEGLTARINIAEQDINAIEGTLTTFVTSDWYENNKLTLTDVRQEFDAIDAEYSITATVNEINSEGVVEKANTAKNWIDGADARITTIAQTVVSDETSSKFTNINNTVDALKGTVGSTIVSAHSSKQTIEEELLNAALESVEAMQEILSTADSVAVAKSETKAVADDLKAEAARIDILQTQYNEQAALIQSESLARADADSSLATQINTLRAETADDIAAAIQTESTARTDAVSALASQITTLQAETASNAAAIQTEATARASEDNALAAEITTLKTETANNEAAIQTESVARTNATEALATQITNLQAKTADDIAAAILEESTARTTATEAISQTVSTLQASMDSSFAQVNTDTTALANEDLALSNRIDTLVAEVGENSAAILAESNARTTADSVLASQITSLQTETANNAASLQTESTARANADSALANQITTLQSESANNTAAIQTEALTRTNAVSALSSEITTLKSETANNTAAIQSEATARTSAVDALASEIDTLQTTTANNTALIQAETSARTSEIESLASDVSLLYAATDENSAAIVSEATARTDALNSVATELERLQSSVGTNTAAILSETSTRATETIALAEDISGLTSRMDTTESNITDIQTAFTTADSALAEDINTLNTKIETDVGAVQAELTDYKRTAISYCVDSNGNVTAATSQATCELVAGNTWVVSAPLAEAVKRVEVSAIDKEGNTVTASAGDLYQSFIDVDGEAKSTAALVATVNDQLAGVFVNVGKDGSELIAKADSFKVQTSSGSKVPFAVVGDEVIANDLIVSSLRIPASGTDSTAIDVTSFDQLKGNVAVNLLDRDYSTFGESSPLGSAVKAVVEYSTEYALFSDKSLKITATANDGYVYLSNDFDIAVEPNKKWYLSAFVYSNTANAAGQIYVQGKDIPAGVSAHRAISFVTGAANQFHRVHGILDLSTLDASLLRLRVDNDAGAGVVMYFDGIMLEPYTGQVEPSVYVLPPRKGIQGVAGVDGIDGTDGIDGRNGSYKSFIYKISSTTPSLPTGGSYDGTSEVIPTGWTDNPTHGETDIEWVSTTTYSHDGVAWANSGWSTPKKFYQRGTDGVTTYTWLKYADSPTTGMSDSPTGKTYIGLAYNKTTSQESNVYSDYAWSLIKGEDGVAGAKGEDGQTTYTWIKYANDSAGTGISNFPDGKTYIGIAYNKLTATESNNPSDYTWSLIQGPQGIQGIKGDTGADGVTYYTWIKYADSPTSGMSNYPEGKSYLGVAYNKDTASESNNYGDYTWTLIKGEQGIQGPAGSDGQTTYTWIKYADDSSGAGISDSSDGKTYIGIAANKTTSTESNNPSDYTWSLIKGADGISEYNNILEREFSTFGESTFDLTYKSTTTAVEFSSEESLFSAKSLKITASGENAYVYFGRDYAVPLAPSSKWLVSAYVKTNVAGAKITYYFKVENPPVPLSAHKGVLTTVPEANTWVRVSTVLDMSAYPNTQALFRIDNDQGAGTVMYIDGVMIERYTGQAEPSTYILPAPRGFSGADGIDGKDGSYKSFIYKVGSSAPTTPTGGSYDGSTETIPTGWTDDPTHGENDVEWVSTTTYTHNGSSWSHNGWSTPKKFYQKGDQGIQGPQGPQGIQGIKGDTGANGVTYYTWVKYADTPTSGMSDYPSGKSYLGIAYNKTTPTESTNYSDYTWSLIKGEQGVQGPAGTNGQTTYTWIKYANDANGTGMSDSPTGKTFIGIAVNKTTATESNTASDYTWTLIQGPKGDTGLQGVAGADGITPYINILPRDLSTFGKSLVDYSSHSSVATPFLTSDSIFSSRAFGISASNEDAWVYLDLDTNTPIEPKSTWLVSAYVKSTHAGGTHVYMYFPESNVHRGGTFNIPADKVNTWVRVHTTINCTGVSDSEFRFRLDNDRRAGSTILFDGIMIEKYVGQSEPSPYNCPPARNIVPFISVKATQLDNSDDPAEIVIAGQDRITIKSYISTEGRGHTLVCLDPSSGSITHQQTYDTYASATDTDLLAAHINAQPAGRIIILTSFDATHMNEALKNALLNCGASNTSLWGGARKAHAFIGQKGAQRGTAYEQITSGTSAPSKVSATYNTTGLILKGALPAPTGSAGLYADNNYMGYHNGTSWQSYIGADGQTYFGNESNYVQWNNSTLTVKGSITGSNITGSTITGNTITGNTITGSTITGSTIDGGTIVFENILRVTTAGRPYYCHAFPKTYIHEFNNIAFGNGSEWNYIDTAVIPYYPYNGGPSGTGVKDRHYSSQLKFDLNLTISGDIRTNSIAIRVVVFNEDGQQILVPFAWGAYSGTRTETKNGITVSRFTSTDVDGNGGTSTSYRHTINGTFVGSFSGSKRYYVSIGSYKYPGNTYLNGSIVAYTDA